MKTLVIGGTGFLSGAVAAECLAAGHTVSVVTRGSSNRTVPAGIEALRADRSKPDELRAALVGRTFDLVIDCVLFRPDDARVAVELLHDNTRRYIFISTDFVYGGEPRRYPLEENTPRESLNNYGKQKAACEDIFFEAWQTRKFPVVALRPPHIMGTGSLIGSGSLEGRDPWILWRLRNGQPILLLDGGAFLIQPVHKTDIARASLAIAAAPQETVGGQAYNIVGPDCVTTRAYYETVCELLGVDGPRILNLPSSAYTAAWPDRAAFAQNRAYSTARLTRDTGFTPSIRLHEALSEMIAEYETRSLPAGVAPSGDTPLALILRDHEQAVAELLRKG